MAAGATSIWQDHLVRDYLRVRLYNPDAYHADAIAQKEAIHLTVMADLLKAHRKANDESDLELLKCKQLALSAQQCQVQTSNMASGSARTHPRS